LITFGGRTRIMEMVIVAPGCRRKRVPHARCLRKGVYSAPANPPSL
jgi:hypothetical protein